MNSLENKILEYGRKRETCSLQNLIFNTDKDELVDLVKSRLNSTNFECLWDYLLKSFQDSPRCHKIRISLVLTFLKKLDGEVLSSHQSCSLVQRICMDLMKFKTEHLVDLCNFCLNSIQVNKTGCNVSFSWKDLLPNTLRVLSERDMVEFNELEYTGQEFKTNIINNLCMSNWSPSIVTSLTAMFIDMPLTKEERLKVVHKLASYIEKLTPQEVPPFVYHLLRLCQHQNSRAVFLKLQHYFGLRIYSSTRNNSSESPDLDIIENAEDHDVLEAENTVLFHIHNAAAIGHNCIKDYINSLKNTIKSPDFILHPFQLLALFTIATVQQYEETVFDIIRHSIVRSYHEQQKQTSSFWYRDMIRSSVKAEDVFAQIMNSGDREFILEALVNFGFTLLGVGSALGRDVIAEKQWSLGTLILLKVIKRKKHVTSIILKTFCNHIVTRQNATQYIEFLYILCKTSPLLMLENQSCIVELIEGLVQMPSNSANQLLDPLMLLTKVSPTIRDQLILILRKALYSRSIETRQTAVNGFVKLITTLRISSGGVLSQSGTGSFSSGYSLYTQISLNRTTQTVGASTISNEAICWEVLGILKRCFMQQAEVRARLYEVLFDAICINPELGIPVLDVFWFHFVEYYVMDEESYPPLNFKKVAELRETDSVLLEPLGKFIFTISQIVAKVIQSEDDRDNPTVVNYVEILDSLCNRMSTCELVHFELDDGTDLTDVLPESQQKMHILKEVTNVYEALMGYKIATLSIDNENQCRIINTLYQGYSRFLHFGKNLSKPKKSKKTDKSSQKDDGKQSQKTSKETQTQATATRKIEQATKGQSKPYKAPDTLLDFATVEKALKTLLEPSVPWATINDANTIKTRTDIHRHFIQAAIYLVGKNKNQKVIDSQYQKSYYGHVTAIAATLYNRIITRFSDYVDFDCMSAVSSVECFHAGLLLVNGQFKNNLINFFSKVGNINADAELIEHLEPIIKEFQTLFETKEDDLSSDIEIKRLSLMVVNVLSVLCSFIPDGSNVLSVQVYDWLKQYACNNTVSSKVAGPFSSLLLETHVKYQEGLTLFERLSVSLKDVMGIVDEETIDENTDDFRLVDVGTSSVIIQTLCSHVKNNLDDVDSIITKIKSDHYVLTYPGEDDDDKKKNALKAKEKGVSSQLLFVVDILANLARIAVPPGNISDAVFKNIMQLYSSLSALTKYFMSRSSKNNLAFQGLWFERLVKKAGKQLAPLVYKLIVHLEGYHNQEDQTQGRKKAVEGSTMKSKVLRETKIIPKVIYEIEQFSKTIIQLTKKTKFDLSKYVGQGTVRDFRILQPALKEVLQKDAETANSTQSTQDDVERSRDEVRSDVESDAESIEGNEELSSPPPTKKSKR